MSDPASLSTRHWLKTMPQSTTMTSACAIINGLIEKLDLDRFMAYVDTMNAHIARGDNPHHNHIVDIKDQLNDFLYSEYSKITTTPLDKATFTSTIFDTGAIIELMRRLILNRFSTIEGVGATGIPAYSGDMSMSDLYPTTTPLRHISYLLPHLTLATGGTFPYAPISLPDLPISGSTILFRVGTGDSTAERPLLRLTNTDGSKILQFTKVGGFANRLRLDMTGIVIQSPQIGANLATYIDMLYPLSNRGDNLFAMLEATYNSVSKNGFVSFDPPTVDYTEGYFAITMAPTYFCLYYIYQQQIQSFAYYVSGYTEPLTQIQIGFPVGKISSGDVLQSLSVYPEIFSDNQASSILATL